ncbi:MAG: PKD domain-containing protein [Bacteroidales bacterium]|nr:PKD domain-containing protein [Bacteroidales bacterium]
MRLILLFFSLIILNFYSLAQVTADFTPSATEGCSPLVVVFTNNSSGTGTLSYSWDLGNGNTSNIENPLATYGTPGVYTVILTVSNGTATDVHSVDITVFASPEASFSSSSTIGCSPYTVSFTDNSVQGDGAITDWYWDLGGGFSSTEQNPSVTYGAGIFSVSLNLTDENGCTDFFELTDYISISPTPFANFDASQLSGCNPFTANFTNTSTGTGLTYEWDLNGDGSPDSYVANPSMYYESGTYNCYLEVTEINGCTDDTSFQIVVDQVVADFDFVGDEFSCPGQQVVFTINSQGPAVTWLYGDGGSGSQNYHTYSTPGTYVVSMITYDPADPDNCIDTAQLTLIVENVEAAFVPTSPTISCLTPFEVNWDASTSVGAASYFWYFGDGFVEGSSSPSMSHTYNSPGLFTVSLVAYSEHGCKDSIAVIHHVSIQYPVIHIQIDTSQSDCARDITFSYDSTTIEGFVSWEWHFDNNSPEATSNEFNPTQFFSYNDYIHANSGLSNVTLTVTTASGCTATDSYEVYTGIPPVAAHYIFSDPEGYPNYENYFYSCPCFTGNVDDIDPCPCMINTYVACAFPDSVQFNDSSYFIWDGVYYDMDNSNDSYSWDWDFGEIGGHSTEEDPHYWYDDTVGYMDVQLVVGYNNCYDTILTDSMVFIKGPVIKPSPVATFDCDFPFDYSFSADLVSVTQISVDFGDGTIIDSVFNVDTTLNYVLNHSFDTAGDYWVVYYAVNDSTYAEDGYLYPAYDDTLIHKHNCYFEDSILVRVRNLFLSVEGTDTTICLGNNVYMDLSNSTDEYNDDLLYWFNYGDGSLTNDISSHYYSSIGGYEIMTVAQAANGCRDTVFQHVDVLRVTALFNLDEIDRCAPFIVNFSDASTTMPYGEIETWSWTFGDGTPTITGGDTISEITHEYVIGGSFTINMSVVDTNGCSGSYSRTISSWYPDAQFSTLDTTLCAGDTVIINNNSAGFSLNFSWFVNNDIEFESDTTENFIYVVDTAGNYNFALLAVAEGDSTCRDSLLIDEFLHVQDVFSNFNADITYHECNPGNVQFTFQGSSDNIGTWAWNFGDGGLSASESPVTNTYSIPGVYDVSLTVTTTFGCVDDTVFTNYITVNGAYATFSTVPDHACLGDTIAFYVESAIDVNEIIWDFGDGSGSTDLSSPVYHTYSSPGSFYTYVTYNDGSGICEPKTVALPLILIEDMVADFSTFMGPEPYCEAVSGVSFTNNSSGTAIPDSYYWDFGNGIYSSEQNPSPVDYTSPGEYVITLVLQNEVCNTQTYDTIEIFPSPSIDIIENQLICPNSGVELWGTDLNPVWSPSDGLSSTNVYNPIATPLTPTTYYLSVTDDKGCTNDTSVFVDIFVGTDPYLSATPYDSLYLGEETTLLLEDIQENASYYWGPSSYHQYLSCIDCPNPVFHPADSSSYTFYVTIIDSLGCDTIIKTIIIDVDFESDIVVPTAFTPNGDGNNDIIYLFGRGVETVYEFRIYNRWGQEVFFSDDITKGWDGFYKGKLQNIDTYVWKASVRYLNGIEESKQGAFNLIR